MSIIDQLLIGQSEAIQKVRSLVTQVAGSDLNAIISGESGVGKELVAQALHLFSHRKDRPFIKVNCAAIPSELLESELFGYEKGAFTGADRTKEGKFEIAHKGTILLDEIGDMAIALQSKMLQVLQDFQFSRLGGKRDIKVDCWVLAATNHDLAQDVKQGLFREDLYYRLNIIRIYIPPLRERPEDVEPLVRHFGREVAKKSETPPFEFTEEVLTALQRHAWPGNVRELRNVVNRLMLLGDWDVVQDELSKICAEGRNGSDPTVLVSGLMGEQGGKSLGRSFPSLKEVKKRATQEAERQVIRAVLEETGWNRRKAARVLEISYKALLYKIRELGLKSHQ
jgi:two-component system response regulator AtoC